MTRNKVHLHLFSGLFASNHISMHLPCFHSRHAPFCTNLLASDNNSKLQVGICKCTRCGSCTAPTGINGVSTGSANGGRRPKIIPLRNELVWLTESAMTLGGQRNFGKAALGTSVFKPAWQQKSCKLWQTKKSSSNKLLCSNYSTNVCILLWTAPLPKKKTNPKGNCEALF